MGTMLVELYDALKEAGASKEKARAAAESLVIGGDRLERIEEQTGRLPKMQDQIDHTREDIARLDKELAVINAQIDPLEWMNGIVIAGVLALIIKTFFA
jgi:chromosome segregation ATPase